MDKLVAHCGHNSSNITLDSKNNNISTNFTNYSSLTSFNCTIPSGISTLIQADPQTVGKAALVIMVIFIALTGNIFITFSFFHNFKMRTITNTLVVNLCFADTFSCVLDLPHYLAAIGSWPFSQQRKVCQALVFFDHLLKVASILSMTGIALDRYFNLVRTSRRRMTLERARIVIAWCWAQSLVSAIPWNLLSYSTKLEELFHQLCANFPYFYEPGMGLESIAVLFKVTCVLLPILVIYYVFYRIIKAVRRKRKVEVEETTSGVVTGISTERFAVQAYARSGVTAILLFGMYLLCTAPFTGAIMWTITTHKQLLNPHGAFAVYFLFRLKCALFPLLYISRNRTILSSVQQKLSCCTKTERKMKRRQENLTFVTKNSSMFSRNRQKPRTTRTMTDNSPRGNSVIVDNFVDIAALDRSSFSTNV